MFAFRDARNHDAPLPGVIAAAVTIYGRQFPRRSRDNSHESLPFFYISDRRISNRAKDITLLRFATFKKFFQTE